MGGLELQGWDEGTSPPTRVKGSLRIHGYLCGFVWDGFAFLNPLADPYNRTALFGFRSGPSLRMNGGFVAKGAQAKVVIAEVGRPPTLNTKAYKP